MTLMLSESDVRKLLTMKESVECVERCFEELGSHVGTNSPRTRSVIRPNILHVLHALLPGIGRAGAKVYLSTKQGARFVILLFDTNTSELLSVMSADSIGRFRTGAASGVATKYLSGLRSVRFGLAGTGSQAVTQLTAIHEIAGVEAVSVWSPKRESREAFKQFASRDLGIECVPADTVREAFSGKDVATTITTAREPFVTAADVADISHINVCGSNWAEKRELDSSAVASFGFICVDDLRQSMVEAGDLIQAAQEGAFSWKNAVELASVVHSKKNPNSKTLFKSNGMGAEDVALASVVYEKAEASGEFEDQRFDLHDVE
jgi:alanine dehydrogenase